MIATKFLYSVAWPKKLKKEKKKKKKEAVLNNWLNNHLKIKEPIFSTLFLFLVISKKKNRLAWKPMITETCLSHVWATNIYCYEALNSFGYTSNRCTFDMQYFYCFNSFLLKISTSNKIWRPWFLDFKCTFFNLYMEWQCFTADKNFICIIFINPCSNLWSP